MLSNKAAHKTKMKMEFKLDPLYALGAVAVLYVGRSLVQKCILKCRGAQLMRSGKQFRTNAVASIAYQAARLPPAPAQADKIVELSASEVVIAIREGTYSCVDVVVSYCHNAFNIGHLKLNAVTEAFFEEAIAAARETDKIRAAHAAAGTLDKLPLLFGLPISVKDQFIQKGAATTMGCSVFTATHANDGAILKAFRALGAIPFVRSCAPQMLMLPETMSDMWGVTVNPYCAARGPGGSSGGESALIASRCSPLGLGGDIGGSLRLPSAFCGLVALKGTATRFSKAGSPAPRVGGISGNEAVLSTMGTMGRTVADACLGTASFLSREMYAEDTNVVRTGFDVAAAVPTGRTLSDMGILATSAVTPAVATAFPRKEKLRVGVWRSLGFWEGSTAELRSVDLAEAALRAAGHEIVEFRMDGQWVVDAVRTYYRVMAADGGMRCFVEALGYEPLHAYYHQLHALSRLPACLRAPIGWVLRVVDGVLRGGTAASVAKAGGKPSTGVTAQLVSEAKTAAVGTCCSTLNPPSRLASVLTAAGGCSAYGYFQTVVMKHKLTRAVLAEMEAKGLDVFLAPPPPPAFPHGASKFLSAACATTFIWNLTHLPAGVVPTTVVNADDRLLDSWADSLTRATLKTGMYTENAVGMPVCAQVVGFPNADELVLRVMGDIEARVPKLPLPAVRGGV